MIYTVIAKPTKECNADCSYCSAPPDDENSWEIDDFKIIFDRIMPSLASEAVIIWHGGEPMLMGPDFYVEAYDYARSKMPTIKFSMQTNLLLYSTKRWKSIFHDIFEGRVSTSFDPDEQNRTIKGSSEKYSRAFYKKIKEVTDDGVFPMVIGTYTSNTAKYAVKMYELSQSMKDKSFNIRFNYRYPAGRDSDEGVSITPHDYGNMLIEMYDRWISEMPNFSITPLDQMLQKCIGLNTEQCPWTRSCGGQFIGIEPNGDVYNCGEFADLKKDLYRFGNVKTGTLPYDNKLSIVNIVKKEKSVETFSKEMMSTKAANLMKRRQFDLPKSCIECRHFKQCQGGCMRDAELFERGLGGKFYYCESWIMVFDRIKESIMNGEADAMLARYTDDVQMAKKHVSLLSSNLIK